MTKVTVNFSCEEPKRIHRIGNWYRNTEYNELYILASVKGKAVLICTDGHFWNEPQEYLQTEGMYILTENEFDFCCRDSAGSFIHVPVVDILGS